MRWHFSRGVAAGRNSAETLCPHLMRRMRRITRPTLDPTLLARAARASALAWLDSPGVWSMMALRICGGAAAGE